MKFAVETQLDFVSFFSKVLSSHFLQIVKLAFMKFAVVIQFSSFFAIPYPSCSSAALQSLHNRLAPISLSGNGDWQIKYNSCDSENPTHQRSPSFGRSRRRCRRCPWERRSPRWQTDEPEGPSQREPTTTPSRSLSLTGKRSTVEYVKWVHVEVVNRIHSIFVLCVTVRVLVILVMV